MRAATTALRDFLLTSTDAIVRDLVTITLVSATVYRWTSHGEDITTGGNTYSAGGTGTVPLLGRGKIRDTTGLDPSSLSMRLGCGSGAQLGGVRLQLAAVNGVLDGARVSLARCYLDAAGVVIGTLARFEGRVSGVNIGSNSVELSVSSELETLSAVLPRHLYGPLCTHAVFDAGCGVVRADYTTTGVVQSGSTEMVINHLLGSAPDYFVGGAITITSGTLNGLIRTVTASDTTTISVDVSWPSAPTAGTTFSAYPGCDKSLATCRSKFRNLPRRRGFDFVPVPETVIP